MYAITPKDRAEALKYGEHEFIGKAVRKWNNKRKANKAQRQEDRHARKIEKIGARGDAKATARSAGPGFFDRALDTVGGLLGGGGGEAAGLPMPTGIQGIGGDLPPEPQPKKNNSAIIIGGVVLLVVIVGAIVYMKNRQS